MGRVGPWHEVHPTSSPLPHSSQITNHQVYSSFGLDSGISQNHFSTFLGTFILFLFFPLHWILLLTAWMPTLPYPPATSRSYTTWSHVKLYGRSESLTQQMVSREDGTQQECLSAQGSTHHHKWVSFPLDNYIRGGHQPFFFLSDISRNTRQSHCWTCGDVRRNGKGV